MALTAVNENPWGSNLGVGSNTAPVFVNPNPIHKGSWLGLPDLSITESLKGTINTNAPTPIDLSQYNNVPTIEAYKNRGWNDLAAIKADIANKGSTYQDIINTNNSGGTGVSPTPQAKTYTYNGKTTTSNNPSEVFNQLGLKDTDYSNWQNQFSDPQDFLNSIERGYQSQENVFGQQENALQQALKNFTDVINADYSANLAKGKAAKDSTAGKLAENKVIAEQKKQDALSAASKLYNELQQGFRQRFGGSTSAGEASQAILGSEQQRQLGNVQKTYQETVRDIQRQSIDLDNNYNAAVQQLDVDMQRQKAEVQQNFQTNMTNIANNRASSFQAKEQAKMTLLMNVRDNLAAIEQSKVQYKQQLDMMNQQAKIQLDAQLKAQSQANQGFVTNAQNAVGQIPTNVTTNLTPSATKTTTNVMPGNALTQAQGQISTPYSYKDELGLSSLLR